jgi:hypothetical protein
LSLFSAAKQAVSQKAEQLSLQTKGVSAEGASDLIKGKIPGKPMDKLKTANSDRLREKLGKVEQNASRDGKITAVEKKNLSQAKSKVGALGKTLGEMKQQDKKADKRDNAAKDKIRGGAKMLMGKLGL